MWIFSSKKSKNRRLYEVKKSIIKTLILANDRINKVAPVVGGVSSVVVILQPHDDLPSMHSIHRELCSDEYDVFVSDIEDYLLLNSGRRNKYNEVPIENTEFKFHKKTPMVRLSRLPGDLKDAEWLMIVNHTALIVARYGIHCQGGYDFYTPVQAIDFLNDTLGKDDDGEIKTSWRLCQTQVLNLVNALEQSLATMRS